MLFDLAATANLGKLRNGRGLVRRTWSLGPWDGRSESGLWGYFDVDTGELINENFDMLS